MMNSRPTKKPDRRGPFRNLRAGVAKIISSHVFQIMLSFGIALAAWSLLLLSDSTLTRQKVIPAAPVSVTGTEMLKSRGFIVTDNITELIPTVRIAAEVTQNNYARANASAFGPHLDLNAIITEGEVYIPVNFTSQFYGSVTSCEPSGVTLHVERYITRRVPVVLEQTGGMPDGWYLDSTKVDPAMLSVSGPASLVSTVARAAAVLDRANLSGERPTDRTALPVQLQTASGEVVQSRLISITNQTVITDSIVAETELVPMKRVPVAVETLVTGEVAEGYELLDVVPAQREMDVAAAQDTLDAIEDISADTPMDVTGLTADTTGFARLKRLSGIENTIPLDLEVRVQIAEKTIDRTFRSVEVVVEGLAAEQRASLSNERMTVQLTGGYHFIHSLSREDVQLYVDVSGLEAGRHELPVQIRIDNAADFTCALGTPTITVTLRDK